MLLCLDTSTAQTTLALAEGDDLLGTLTARAPGRHEETLLPMIERLLESAGRQRSDLRTVAVGLGPGGFTSLRVGIASAKGLAIGLGAELVGVGSLRVLARGLASAHAVSAVFVDAQRGEVYGAAYAFSGESGETLVEPMHGAPEEVAGLIRARAAGAKLVVGGDALAAHGERLLSALGPSATRAPAVYDRPQPSALYVEAMHTWRREGLASLDALEPYYVRPSDAKLPMKKLRTSLADD